MMLLRSNEFLGKTTEQFSLGDYDISMVKYKEPVTEEWHSHEKYHLSLILQGGNLECRKRNDFEALPGRIMFYRKNELHCNKHTVFPSENLNIEIGDSFFTKNELSTTTFNTSVQKNPAVQLQLLKIYKELKINDSFSANSIHSSLLTFFSRHTNMVDCKPVWVDTIRELLCDRWDEFVTLKELSKELQIHPVTISRYFSKYFNCTLGEYMRRIKIEKAIVLLKNGNMPLTEITFLCGFSDQSHFIRIFKHNTGFKPKEFRLL